MKIRLPEKQTAGIVAGFIRLLSWTLRVHIEDPNGFLDGKPGGPFIAIAWHNRILGLLIGGKHRTKIVPMTVLTSASRDGALLSEVMSQFGLNAVRGSSSRKGAAALLQLIQEHRRGRTIIITPDGPRGPCYTLSPGVILLAQKTGARVLTMHIRFSRNRRLKSWDRFFIPLPFSKISIHIDPARVLPKTETPEEFERQRLDLENLLRTGTGE